MSRDLTGKRYEKPSGDEPSGDLSHRFGSVALIGRPNAGKSTLLNYIIGEKVAIVTDKPQTTRTAIMGVVTKPGWQMVIFDAPGVHVPKDRLGRGMMSSALDVVNRADVIYYISDASAGFGDGEARVLDILSGIAKPVFLLLNKIDLLEKTDLPAIIDNYSKKRVFARVFPISAKSGENIPDLLSCTVGYFREGPPVYDADEMTDQPGRIMVAEFIREKAIMATREEVPYAIAVYVEKMESRSDGLTDIYAVIVVERQSQKGILIGKGGAGVKRIGELARKDIEELLGVRVNLRLFVQVREKWRDNESRLRDYGLV